MVDQTLARYINERNVLTVLRRRGHATRAELSRLLDLTPPSLTRLTADMLKRGLLRASDQPRDRTDTREPGRPGTVLAINPDAACFLGVEIGVGILRFAVLDLTARLAFSVEQPVPHPVSPDAVVGLIGQQFAELGRDRRFGSRLQAAAVTVPGLVQLTGHVVNLPIVGWRDLDLRAMLTHALPIPFTIENSANAAAFGAAYTHPDIAGQSTLYLKIGTGCGGAAIFGGRLFRGSDGTGMEAGHIRIASDGPQCSCGQRGCLETFVNFAALRDLLQGVEWAGDSDPHHLPAQVAQHMAEGDPAAITAAAQVADRLATGLVPLVNLLNPDTIILGGGMMPVIAPSLPRIDTQVAAGIIPGTRLPRIFASPLGVGECSTGAACIAHHRMLDANSLDLVLDLR